MHTVSAIRSTYVFPLILPPSLPPSLPPPLRWWVSSGPAPLGPGGVPRLALALLQQLAVLQVRLAAWGCMGLHGLSFKAGSGSAVAAAGSSATGVAGCMGRRHEMHGGCLDARMFGVLDVVVGGQCIAVPPFHSSLLMSLTPVCSAPPQIVPPSPPPLVPFRLFSLPLTQRLVPRCCRPRAHIACSHHQDVCRTSVRCEYNPGVGQACGVNPVRKHKPNLFPGVLVNFLPPPPPFY